MPRTDHNREDLSSWLSGWVYMRGRLQLAVESFNKSVGHRAVHDSSNMFGVERMKEVGEQCRSELTATI